MAQMGNSIQEKVVGSISKGIGNMAEREANKQINAKVNEQKEGLFGSSGNQSSNQTRPQQKRTGFGLFG